MRVFWDHAPGGGGHIYVRDILGRGMFYLTDDKRPQKCSNCGHMDYNPPGRRRLRWLSHDVGLKPSRFLPRWMYLPPEQEPLGKKPGARVKVFLERGLRLLKRTDGMLYVWWHFEDMPPGHESAPPGRYLALSPYWSPVVIQREDWCDSEVPGRGYPRRVSAPSRAPSSRA